MCQNRRQRVAVNVKKLVRVPKEEWIIVENTHEPIIDKELFNLAQDLNTKRGEESHYKGQRQYNNPYAGLLMCGDCGRALTIAHYNKGEIVENKYNTLIEVDGGVNDKNMKELYKAGADILTIHYESIKNKDETKAMLEPQFSHFFRSDEEGLYYVAFDLFIDLNHMAESYELSYWYKHAHPLNQKAKALREFKKEIQHIVWMSNLFEFDYIRTI